MNNKMLSGLALLCAALLSQSANAGSCGRVRTCEPKHKHNYCHDKKHPFFVTVGAGISWSAGDHVDVDHVTANAQSTTKFWDGAKEGYNDDHGSSEFYTVALGYHWSDLFTTNVELTHRPSYTYKRKQTQDTVAPFNNINGVEAIGEKTRYFDLKGTSLTFNVDLRSGGLFDCMSWSCGDNITFQLILGAGIGISYNRIENFHTLSQGTGAVARNIPQLVRLSTTAAAAAAGAANDGTGGSVAGLNNASPTTLVARAGNVVIGAPADAPNPVLPNATDILRNGGATSTVLTNQVHSIMLDRTKTDFVWQVKVGFEVTWKRFGFDIFYRYHDAGQFRSHNYIVDAPVNFLDPVKVPAWSGDMAAHELCFSCNKRF